MATTARPIDWAYAEAAVRSHSEETGGSPLNAQIIPGCAPRWYVIVTRPGEEHVASGHLIGRRFCVYQPMYTKRYAGGHWRKPSSRNMPLFPGYLFIFAWDMEMHRERIAACPGIDRVLYEGSHPAIVPDKEISELQAREAVMTAIPKRSKRKKWKAIKESVEIVTISPYSAFHGAELLDDEGRISLLHKALGLALSAPASGQSPR